MNHTTPTVSEIATSIRNQLQAKLSQSIPFLPKAFFTVISWALGGLFVLLYRYIGFGVLQLFVAHASSSEITINGRTLIPLVEWGRLVGVGDPFAATRAVHDVEVTVTQQTGSLQAGAVLLHTKSGVAYQTTAEVPLSAATVTVRVRAISDQTGGNGTGAIGNRLVGDPLEFASPLPNVAREARVSAIVVSADDAESWDSYRSRIIARFRARPQGGAYADYEAWAREVPGIVAAYPYTGAPGEVDVYVEASVASSGSPDGIPTSGQLAAVGQAIDFDSSGQANRRPANAAVNVRPIFRRTFNVQVVSLDAPQGTRQEIEDALASYYLEREPFIIGLSVLPRKDRVLLNSIIGIIDSIVLARGGTVQGVVQYVGAENMPSYSLSPGEKAKLGTVSFVG